VRDGQKIVAACACGQIAHFLPGVLQRLHKCPAIHWFTIFAIGSGARSANRVTAFSSAAQISNAAQAETVPKRHRILGLCANPSVGVISHGAEARDSQPAICYCEWLSKSMLKRTGLAMIKPTVETVSSSGQQEK
jgi:hypothetical protein